MHSQAHTYRYARVHKACSCVSVCILIQFCTISVIETFVHDERSLGLWVTLSRATREALIVQCSHWSGLCATRQVWPHGRMMLRFLLVKSVWGGCWYLSNGWTLNGWRSLGKNKCLCKLYKSGLLRLTPGQSLIERRKLLGNKIKPWNKLETIESNRKKELGEHIPRIVQSDKKPLVQEMI